MVVSKCWNVAVASSWLCNRFCRSILSRKNAFQLVVISPTVNGRHPREVRWSLAPVPAAALLLAAIAKRGWYLLAYLPCNNRSEEYISVRKAGTPSTTRRKGGRRRSRRSVRVEGTGSYRRIMPRICSQLVGKPTRWHHRCPSNEHHAPE